MAKKDNYTKDLGKALRTGNLKRFKKFCKKYKLEIPEDEILEISMHKMILGRTDMPKELQEKSRTWLLKRGYRESIY